MSPKMNISKHAKIRCQQRGLSEKDIMVICAFGEPRVCPGGALEYKIMGYEKDNLISTIKLMIKNIENN